MEDIETLEQNITSFEDSIINTLNLDEDIIENRINEELFDTYINNYLSKKLSDQNDITTLFNPIIIKLSKVKVIYNKYAQNITKLSHEEYIDKIKKIINIDIINDYIKNNIEIDYDNEIENYISNLHASNILEDELRKIEDQEWFINYIINFNAKKQKMSFNVLAITFNKKIAAKLIKKHSYFKIVSTENFYNNDTIYINLLLFNIIKKTKNFESALLYLINSCLFELQKQIQRNKEYSMTYDDNIYRFIKENIIYREDSTYYNNNKNYFDIQIDLKDETNRMLNDLINNPLFKDFSFIKDINTENNNNTIKNTKDYNLVDTYIDSLLIKKPAIVKNNTILQMEYNSDGTRKSVIELIEIRKEKENFYNGQINSFKELMEAAPNEAYRKDINNKLENIENNLIGIIRCHNKMIYKALKLINISNLEKLCLKLNKIQLDILEEVIKQEKEDFIKKLESNRRKIFKPTTFLANEQFLTKEYSLSARYESKLRDIRKEKEI